MSVQRKRILVFGASGVGKTSAINKLTGENLPTSDELVGCTLKTSDPILVDRNGISYEFIDTAGLNETDEGACSSVQAIKNLIDLLHVSDGGFNLFIQVVRGGGVSFSKAIKKNTSSSG